MFESDSSGEGTAAPIEQALNIINSTQHVQGVDILENGAVIIDLEKGILPPEIFETILVQVDDKETVLTLTSVCKRWSGQAFVFIVNEEFAHLRDFIDSCFKNQKKDDDKNKTQQVLEELFDKASTLKELEEGLITFLSAEDNFSKWSLEALLQLQSKLNKNLYSNRFLATLCRLICQKIPDIYRPLESNYLIIEKQLQILLDLNALDPFSVSLVKSIYKRCIETNYVMPTIIHMHDALMRIMKLIKNLEDSAYISEEDAEFIKQQTEKLLNYNDS